jgi:urease accessory protein
MTPFSLPQQRLTFMQLADSFFPSGSFTLSHGLEAMVQAKQVTSAPDVEEFLRLLLHNKVGSSDLVALVHAYRASVANDLSEVYRADRCLFAQTVIQETRDAQCKTGQALLMVGRSVWQDAQLASLQEAIDTKQTPGCHPVIFAVVGRAGALDEADTLLAYLHNFVTGLVGAAIRLGVLGHLGAQQLLHKLSPDLLTVAAQAQITPLSEMWSCTPAIDIAQMSHRQLRARQFVN